MFSRPRLGKKRVEAIVGLTNRFIGRHLSVRLDPMFQAVQLPTSIAHLNASLADMNT